MSSTALASSAAERQSTFASIRVLLVAAFILLSVLPLAGATTAGVMTTSAQARQQVFNQLESIADSKAATINSDLANSHDVVRATLADPANSQALIALLTNSSSDEGLRSGITAALSAELEAQNDYTEFFVYDASGEILVSTNRAQIGKVVTRQPYFEDSLEGEHLQPPFYELGTTSLIMVLSRPVYAEDGSILGVLAGRLNLNELSEIMTERSGLGQTGETYLVSPESNYLVTPSRFEGYLLTHTYHSDGIDRALAGQDGSASYASYRGETVLGAYRWLPELEVALVAEINEAEALRASRAAAATSIGVATIAAIIAGGVGFVLAIRITQPITQLTDITRRFAEGDLNQRVNITQRNEIGELGRSFNVMADELQATLKSLEASIKEARTATAMAREANRLKSEFLSTMSHELRTPLNAIIGFTEILMAGMSGEMTEKQAHKISRIHLNSKRLLDLINDLLDLAKIEAGRVEVLHEPFSPRELAASVQAQTESLAENKGLVFSVSVDPGLPPMLVGDAARIEQVAKNLLSNAFKFTKQGGVEFRLNANGGHTWNLSVTDTGIGIPAHALEFIFDEFRQVDGTSQRAYGGSGLGLAITRNLARIMGGDVRASSTLGKGSTFTVTLPLVVLEVDAPELGVLA